MSYHASHSFWLTLKGIFFKIRKGIPVKYKIPKDMLDAKYFYTFDILQKPGVDS